MFCLPRGKIVFTDIPLSGRQNLNLTGNHRLVFPTKQLWNQKLFCLRYAEKGTSQTAQSGGPGLGTHRLSPLPEDTPYSAGVSCAMGGCPSTDRSCNCWSSLLLFPNANTPTKKLMENTHCSVKSTLSNSNEGGKKGRTSSLSWQIFSPTRLHEAVVPPCPAPCCQVYAVAPQTLTFHLKVFPCIFPGSFHS